MGKVKTIGDMRAIIEAKGGQLLSATYQNCHSDLTIKCAKGHIWTTRYDNLRKDSWCKICVGRKLTLEHAQDVATRRNGKCLSEKYVGSGDKLLWQCKYGHTWYASYSDVNSNGSWCPECSCGLYERICRNSLEKIFNKLFPKARPKWLINHLGNRMELDGYCEQLGIAFEHNGCQHYRSIEYYDASRSLEEIKSADNLKLKICSEHGVKIIIIPELYTKLYLKDLKEHLRNEFHRLNIIPPQDFDNFSIDDIDAHSSVLDDYKKIATEKGGKLLSTNYLGSGEKLEWECAKEHRWRATPSMVKHETWCPKCFEERRKYLNNKHNIEYFKKYAENKGGECLTFFGRNPFPLGEG